MPSEQEKEYPEPSRFGVMPAYGFFCRHVKGIQFDNVDLAFEQDEQRPAFVLDEVSDAQFYFLKAQRVDSGARTFLLRNVTGFRTPCENADLGRQRRGRRLSKRWSGAGMWFGRVSIWLRRSEGAS